MKAAKRLVSVFSERKIRLAVAESCTAGLVMAELSRLPGTGQIMDLGIVVYSRESKERCLGVDPRIIDSWGLTSEAVAREMALGVLHLSDAQVALANTGVAGPGAAEDGTPPGTVCFAWAFRQEDQVHVYHKTHIFLGSRNYVRKEAVKFALKKAISYHDALLNPEVILP